MALKDSTNILSSSIEQKAKTGKNFDTKNNYWLQGLQDKINAEWPYRSNRADIEEELVRQTSYTSEDIKFTPLEVVIQEVVGDKGEKFSKDWRRIVTRDCNYDNGLGKRFRFTDDLLMFNSLTPEEKKWKSSIWLGVNIDTPSPTCGLVLRRCNAVVGMVGTATGKIGGGPENDILEYHYEPIIIEDNIKYFNTFYNFNLNLANAEFFMICQYNYFTQFINVEDRVILGDPNPADREKNNVYRVISVQKFGSQFTYDFINPNLSIADVPMIAIGLEKTPIEEGDNFERGTAGYNIACRAPVYKVETSYTPPAGEYAIVLEEPYDTQINAEDRSVYAAHIYQGDTELHGEGYTIEVETSLEGTTKPQNYYRLEMLENNSFAVTCVFGYVKSNLIITIKWKERPEVQKQIEVELRSW